MRVGVDTSRAAAFLLYCSNTETLTLTDGPGTKYPEYTTRQYASHQFVIAWDTK